MISMLFFLYSFFFYCDGDHRDLHSFPTRRSSDLAMIAPVILQAQSQTISGPSLGFVSENGGTAIRDRKSTRLNSSHTVISYAVFCLKKKKKKKEKQKNTKKNTQQTSKLTQNT